MQRKPNNNVGQSASQRLLNIPSPRICLSLCRPITREPVNAHTRYTSDKWDFYKNDRTDISVLT